MSQEMCKADADFESMTDDQLDRAEASFKGSMVENMIGLAGCFMAKVARKKDTTWYEEIMPACDWRAIAERAMLPEVFFNIKDASVKRMVAAMDVAEQKRLVVDMEKIKVAERLPDGKLTHRLYTVDRLPKQLVKQVFEHRRIRTYEEQVALTPEPIIAPVIDQPDREAWLVELKQLPNAFATGTKREQRRAADRARELWGKLALTVL